MNTATLEVLIYLGVSVFILYKLNAISILAKIGKFKISGLTILAILVLSGQGIKNDKITYPFSYWGMYSHTNPTDSYVEYIITLSDGSTTHYPFRLVTNYSARAFMRNVEYSINSNEKELKKTLTALRQIYKDEYPEQKIMRFDINRITIPVKNWDHSQSIEKTNLHTIYFSK